MAWVTNEEAAQAAVTGALRARTVTPDNPSPPSNFGCAGEAPPTTIIWAAAPAPGAAHLFAPATGGVEHEGRGTELVDPITGTRSTGGPPYVISPNSDHPSSNNQDAGELPDWVPENAVIHIDLVGGTPQGRAWVQGTGEVAVDTLLGSDPNTEAVWGTSEFNADNLGPDGYVGAPSRYIAFTGAARTLILSGATLRYSIWSSGDTYPDSLASLVPASSTHNLSVAIASPCTAESWGGTINDANMFANEGVGAFSNALAWTITATRFEYAISGSEAVAHAITEADYPLSGTNQIVAALVGIENSQEYLQSVTLYDPLPDTTGLSGLSEVTP